MVIFIHRFYQTTRFTIPVLSVISARNMHTGTFPLRRITLSGRASNVFPPHIPPCHVSFNYPTNVRIHVHTSVSYPRISLLVRGHMGQHKVSARIKARPSFQTSSPTASSAHRPRTVVCIAGTHIYFLLIWKTIR